MKSQSQFELPADLQQAENRMFNSLSGALTDANLDRISLDIRFEGLRILPIVLRLYQLIKN